MSDKTAFLIGASGELDKLTEIVHFRTGNEPALHYRSIFNRQQITITFIKISNTKIRTSKSVMNSESEVKVLISRMRKDFVSKNILSRQKETTLKKKFGDPKDTVQSISYLCFEYSGFLNLQSVKLNGRHFK